LCSVSPCTEQIGGKAYVQPRAMTTRASSATISCSFRPGRTARIAAAYISRETSTARSMSATSSGVFTAAAATALAGGGTLVRTSAGATPMSDASLRMLGPYGVALAGPSDRRSRARR
jgi:hypothetical protein